MLDHRERIERECGATVAACRQAMEVSRAELTRLHAALLRGDSDVTAASIEAQQRMTEACQHRWERTRRELEIAHRDRLHLEKLKARRHEALLAALARSEERELDDVNARAKLRQ